MRSLTENGLKKKVMKDHQPFWQDILKSMESELRSDFQESLLPPKPGMYAEKVATAPKAM